MAEYPGVTWHSFDLRSGRRGQKVDTQQAGAFSRIIGEATETQLGVRIWDAETGTQRLGSIPATDPGRTMLVALENGTERPVWGGMVLRRVSDVSEWAAIHMATLEHYLGRRYVGDLAFDNEDQATIAAGLIDELAVDGLDFTVDAPATGTRRDRAYFDDEDKTVLDALVDLMGLEGGLEFTVDLEWADASHAVLTRVLRFRERLGVAAAVPVQLVLPGAVNDLEFTEDYSPDWGANDVLAVSSGEGDARPESAHAVDEELLAGGWARFEHRFTPSTSITSTATLDAHAEGRLLEVRQGLAQFTLSANLDAAPRVDVDFALGDDVTAVLTCPRFPGFTDADGRLVPGYTRTVRCMGWEVDLDTRLLKPTLREVD